MLIDKRQYCQDVSFLNKKMCNAPNQNPLCCGYQQTNSKIYMESQNVHNNQHNTKEKEEHGSRGLTLPKLIKSTLKQH